jgi:hypothetical protein
MLAAAVEIFTATQRLIIPAERAPMHPITTAVADRTQHRHVAAVAVAAMLLVAVVAAVVDTLVVVAADTLAVVVADMRAADTGNR